MGASDFGYRLAEQFNIGVVETRAGLVPLTFGDRMLAQLNPLSGVSIPAIVKCGKPAFEEALLFTHRGLSGPAILQISSFWREGDSIEINMLPGRDVFELLRDARKTSGKKILSTFLSEFWPKRLARMIAEEQGVTGTLGDQSDAALRKIAQGVHGWRVKPTGSEGYRTAEVTLGGIDTKDLDSKTMAARDLPGLYFIGEVVDVTGWLGGYNFQWAWSSGWCAGQSV
jgi:predicted Rossmann fold flavoprotein